MGEETYGDIKKKKKKKLFSPFYYRTKIFYKVSIFFEHDLQRIIDGVMFFSVVFILLKREEK